MNDASCKILVVDDEADVEDLVRQRFRRKIQQNQYAFVFARNGQEALATLRQDPEIDIVMTDLNMPVMDGLTLLSHLNDLNRLMKIVIVSAYGDMHNIRTAMNRGAYDFLTKPIDFQDFEQTIRKTVEELTLRREGQRARAQLTAIQHELSIATRIQQSMLPRTFPAFPGRSDFEIYAEMVPASSVGGDFYDFFLLEDNKLAFVVGDVSGKGVPAAIFMAVSRTLLRATALQGISAGQCLSYVNAMLSKQSEAALFVTIFYGILDATTGEIEFSVGGHNPPYLISFSDGVRRLDPVGGTLVGAFEHSRYETGRVTLRPGDSLFLYTDGVTEAQDRNGEYFSEERLEALLGRVSREDSVPEIVQQVKCEVGTFVAGAPQADDITMLALRYLG